MSLTDAQRKAISIAPITSASLSIISGVIVAGYVIASKERKTIGYHRIILMISIHVILRSLALCVGSKPVPSFIQPSIYGASGTFATCEAQGFIQLFSGIAFILYYCSLQLVIFSRMCSNFIETRQTRLVECGVHVTCNIIPFFVAIIALTRNYINPMKGGGFCGLNVYPDGCLQPIGDTGISISTTCIRGDRDVEKLQHVTAAIRLLGLAIAVLALLHILFRRGCNTENVRSGATIQALVHFFALVLFSAVGSLVYVTWMKRNDTVFPFTLYVTVMALWPSFGLIHLIAYFVLRQTWIHPTSKLRKEEDLNITNNENSHDLSSEIQEEGLGGSQTRRSKRWSLSRIEVDQIRKRAQGLKRWSFSYGERPRPSIKVTEAEQIQRLRQLKSKKLEADCQENNKRDEHCAIFDGTNPSKRWSAFILPSDFDLDEYEEDEEAKYYSDFVHQ